MNRFAKNTRTRKIKPRYHRRKHDHSLTLTHSQARIRLDLATSMVRAPRLAPILHELKAALDIRGPLQELHAQSARDVESDVAVQQPRAGVVGLEGDIQEPVGSHVLRVPARRVLQ